MFLACAGVLGVLAITVVSRGLCAVIPPPQPGVNHVLAQFAADLEYPENELAELRDQDEASRDFRETVDEETPAVENVDQADAEDAVELPVELEETGRTDDVRRGFGWEQKGYDVDTGREAPGIVRDVTYDTAGESQDREDLGEWRKHDMANLRVIEVNQTLYLNYSDVDGPQPQFQPVRMPENFQDYDVNHDGRINVSELRDVTGAVEGAAEALSAADVDGDGLLDEEEFRATMWGSNTEEAPVRSVILTPSEDVEPSEIPRLGDSPHPALHLSTHPPPPRPGGRRQAARRWGG